MSGAVNIDNSISDSESDNGSCNNMSASESDGKDDLEWLKKERKRRRLQLELSIMKLEDKEDKEPRSKARKRSKSNKSRKMTPKLPEKNKECQYNTNC